LYERDIHFDNHDLKFSAKKSYSSFVHTLMYNRIIVSYCRCASYLFSHLHIVILQIVSYLYFIQKLWSSLSSSRSKRVIPFIG